jgi:hypothetical protein
MKKRASHKINMTNRYKFLPNKDVLQLLEEQIAAGQSVRLPVRGNSMSPALMDKRDTVLLRPVNPLQIKVGHVILYRWKDSFLMHRVVGMKEASGSLPKRFICRGDALQSTEIVPVEDVIALAELPAHSFLTLLVRRAMLLARRVGGRLRRVVQRTHCSFR